MDRAEYVAAQKRDIEWVHTHEGAQSVIRSAVPGADVRFSRSVNGEPNGMHYEIRTPRARRLVGGVATELVLTGAYMLPAPVEALRTDARRTVDTAISAVESAPVSLGQ